MPFLEDYTPLRVRLAVPAGFTPLGVYLGQGNPALEILPLDAASEPRAIPLRQIWRERHGGRPAPLLAVALRNGEAWICGPAGDNPLIYRMDAAQAEQLCRRALEEPDRNAALRFLHDALPSVESDLPGIRNEGLLSDHELLRGARHRADWEGAQQRALPLLGTGGIALLQRLGFGVERVDAATNLLRTGSRDRAIAVLLNADETPEGAAPRFQNLSPVSWALAIADQRNLPWVVVVQGDRVRLYPVELGVGVGRRGRTETWIEMRTGLMRRDQAALLWLTLSADALQPDGTLEELLASSKRFAADLAVRLRERIYGRVVPELAMGIATARGLKVFTADELRLTYAMALTVLFRLLFIAYAEDRDLLPFTANDAYRHRALKTKALEMAQRAPAASTDAHLWQEIKRLFDAVQHGAPDLGVPAYGGGLFSDDPSISPAGAGLANVALPDSVFESALRGLLLDSAQDPDEPTARPVDFRSLRVREFGTIYEGLLESELAVADVDLTLKKQKKDLAYVPARAGDPVEVKRGEIYLHNRSGARKSTGSYFTPGFAVDYLLDSALKPALEAHARRLEAMDATDAAEAFFDIRIADIAMGSGHFLVAAIDRVEQALTAILFNAKRPLPGVQAELAKLRSVAQQRLGSLADTVQIEDSQLLRRLIARRCIYGVDINPLAVELSRLSIWIHTFVPGLPLSLLDHSLVPGNALVGIATVGQLRDRFDQVGVGMFPVDADNLLGDASEPLHRLAHLADATPQDIAAGRLAMEQARLAVGPTRALCDLVVAERVAPGEIEFQFEHWARERLRIQANPALARARAVLNGLSPFHFPVAFPEVFLRRRAGFDVIVGNPPWQEVTVEELGFWTRHFPGLKGLTEAERKKRLPTLRRQRPDLQVAYEAELAQTDRERAVLGAGFYPGMGTGDPDLYKAFAWRFWQLAAQDEGRIGVVLPRNAWATLGSEPLRRTMFGQSSSLDIATLTNRGQWVFPEVHPQFTFALVSAVHGVPKGDSIGLRGPYPSRAAWDSGVIKPAHRFTTDAVLDWTSSASLPLLPAEESLEVFAQLRKAPRLDLKQTATWRARPDTELHATNDKPLMKFDVTSTRGLWPVMKGESLDIWQNDRGPETYYAWAKPAEVTAHLQRKRLRSAKSRRDSAHSEFPLTFVRNPKTLPCHAARIAFRDVSRATDTRTVRAALVPPHVFCGNQVPYFLWPSGDEKDQAFLLGVLCSVPLDWYARRFVEIHLNFFVLNPFPVPRPPRTDTNWQRAVALAGRLACPDDRYAVWANSVGVTHGPLTPAEKQEKIEELDAVVARLYGLGPGQLIHIFDTFHEWTDAEEAAAWVARRDRTVTILEGLA